MKDVSFIIIDYKAFVFLQKLVDNIREKTNGLAYEIIVVDNSEDDKDAFFKNNYPEVKYINNVKNLGFSKAVNIGIRHCAGRYILLLNPDTWLENNAALLLAQYLDNHPDTGVVGSKILNNDGSVQFSCRSFPSYKTALFNRYSLLTKIFPRNKHSLAYFNPLNSHNETAEVDWVSGSCMMLRRKALDAIGLFDEKFFMYCEDVDICHRMRMSGWKVVYYPEAVIYHKIGVSSSENKMRAVIERHRSIWIYYKKYFKRHRVIDIAVYIGTLNRCLFHLIVGLIWQ